MRPYIKAMIDLVEEYGEYCEPDLTLHGGSPFYRLPNGTSFSLFSLRSLGIIDFPFEHDEQQYAIDAINRMEAVLDVIHQVDLQSL